MPPVSPPPLPGAPGAGRKSFFRDTLPTAVMVVVGLVTLGVTAWRGWHMATFLHRASRATGTVVDERQHQRVRFATADGREVTFVQNGFLSRPLGAAVPVAYDPADAEGTAQAETIWTTWVSALWGLPMGIGFTLSPLFEMRSSWDVKPYRRSDR